MRIMITGATGYIGNALARKLAETGNKIHALVRNGQVKTLDHPNIKLFKGDINDYSSILNAMDGCEQVYHLASYSKLWSRPREIFYKTNVDGTRNMLQAALEKNISRFVYTSSTAVFGNSIHTAIIESDPRTIGFDNDYDLSKCMAEKLVIDYVSKGLHAVIVNPSRVYGPGKECYSNVIDRYLKAVLKYQPVVIPGCLEVIANYSYIDDVINGHILAMNYGKAGDRYILGGENISYRQLINIVKENISVQNAIAIPLPLMKLAGYFQVLWFYLTKKQPSFTPSTIKRYFTEAAFNSNKAITELNYRITPFRQGIYQSICHLKNQNVCEPLNPIR
jgi:NAD+-dependent farnesol dehydrogenase